MSIASTYGINLTLTSSLSSQQSVLSDLTKQVASGQKFDNLTKYDPTDAHNSLDIQNAIVQRQSYISSIQNVQTRLSVYDTTMTDIENMNAQANSLATNNAAYDPTKVDEISQSASNYLKQLTDDLNQQVGGRYIYAGSRYSTPPTVDLTTLSGTPSATTTTNPALPSYDSNYNNATSFTVNSGKTPTGTFTIGNTTIAWSQLENNNTGSVNVTVNGNTHAVAVSGLSTGTTATDYAANLSATLNAVAAAYPDAAGVPSTFSSTSSSGALTLDFGGGSPNLVTPDAGGIANETTWSGGSTPSGLIAQTPNSSAAAYTKDSALIDQNYSVTYGVTSNDASFQKLVNGLRFIIAACTAGKSGDTATYKTDMQQASSLLASSLTGIQTLHSQVASNQNTLTMQTTTQNTNINNLQSQLGGIQKADLTTVGTEINLLQTQLQASYSATSSLEKLSLVKYL